MKKNLLLSAILNVAFFMSAHAQWSIDPNNPAIVCNATGAQADVQSIHDGNGGYYVFWFDDRVAANATELYGQHYDVNGTPQWTTNGKVIYSDSTNDLFYYSVIRNVAGNLFFGITEGAVGTGGDTIRVLKTDPDGNPLWAQPTLVAAKGGGPIYATNVQLIEKDSGVYVVHYLLWTGGSTVLRVNRVNDSGTRLWPLNGIQVPNGGAGGFGMVHDAAGGLLIYWRNGNGAGTSLGVRRMDENGNFLWSGNVNPAAGTAGLGYDYRGVSDNQGGLILTWVEVGTNIKMARIDTTGGLVWSGGVLPVCVESHGQDRCRILMHGNYFFVSWLDSRPPASNSNTYIQKFDMNGQPQWTLDGVRCANINTYIPYTQMVASDSGSVIYTIEGNVYGFVTQKINADSTLAWPAPGTLLCDNSFNPFYDDYTLMSSVDFGAVSFWSTGGTVYTAKVGSNGVLVNVNDIKNTISGFRIYPNPAKNAFTIFGLPFSENEKAEITICDLMGKEILKSEMKSQKQEIDVRNLKSGIYFVQIQSKNKAYTQKLIIHN
jgi:Secretion system C-terminal sorting domain